MKIVIIGAGFTGMQLARTLIEEGNAVVLIDNDAERVRHAGDQLDGLVVKAEGNNLEALEEAGIASADALVTLTEDDETNMITCSLVDAVYPRIFKIARVRNYAYYAGAARTLSHHAEAFANGRPLFGIDRMLHPDVEAAEAIGRALAHGAIGDVTALGGGFCITNLPVGAGCPLDGIALRALHDLPGWRYLIAYVETASGAALPSGETVLRAGDRIGVLSRAADINALAPFVSATSESIGRIAILGAGRIGRLVLDSRSAGSSPSLFERLAGRGGEAEHFLMVDDDPDRCREAAELNPGVRVLCGDILDDDLVMEEGIGACDLFVAASDNYERNLIAAAYLKSRGVPKTIVLTADSAFGGIASQLGVDVAVPMRDTLVDSIMSHLRGANVTAVHTVCGRQFEIVEYDLPQDSPAGGKTLRELAKPGDFLVLLVRAPGCENVVPNGETVLRAGAHLVIISRAGDRRVLRAFGDSR